MSIQKNLYFDNAATTPLHPKVFSAMLPYLKNDFGNPSNLYKLGQSANNAVLKATKTISNILKCKENEIVYTGSATEADNLAILGTARANKNKGNKIIISSVEHKGILAVCDTLGKENFEIVKLPVLKNGLVDLEFLKKSLDEKTIIVSITMADSETGTIQPISQISKMIRDFRESRIMNYELSKKNNSFHDSYFMIHNSFPYFHTDASQAASYLNIDVNKLGVDMMTLSAHKIGGPKGVAGLYVKKGVNIEPLIYGGGQNKLRSGTENVPGIVGFAKALEIISKNKKKEFARIKRLRDILEKGIFKLIPKIILNGHPQKRLPNFLNISILDVEGEALLLHLDEVGIMVGTGSACNSQSLTPSYVLSALGRPYEYIHGSVRFSLGKKNKMNDVKYVIKHLPPIVKKLREISPLNLNLNQKKKISDRKAFIGNQTPHFLKNEK